MKLEQQVASLELAKQLKKLGFKQDSLWCWIDINGVFKLDTGQLVNIVNDKWKNYSAYTVAELGEMLPYRIKFQDKYYFLISWKRKSGEFAIIYKPNEGSNYFPAQIGKTEADARAKMLIYLKENKLI